MFVNFFVLGDTPNEEIETLEAHEKTWAHAKKEEEFQLYKEIYLVEIHPCLMKEEELRKMAENISSSANIDLDLERLETPLSIVKKRVQSIEASRDWANTSLLQSAVNELEATLKETSILLEEGIFRIQTFLIYYDI